MNRLLLLLTIFLLPVLAGAQPGYLFVKKGAKKKKTYEEGDRVALRLTNDTVYYGLITLLYRDTIYLTGKPIPAKDVKAVVLPVRTNKFPLDGKTILLLTGGSALVSGGLMLNDMETPKNAIITGFAMGFGSILVRYGIQTVRHWFRKKEYRMGNKYRIQVLEFHMQGRLGF
jgi:hypothetical protein